MVEGPGAAIDIEIGLLRPDVQIRLPASEDSLPVVRQVLRSIGETVDADLVALEDAELAVTEALANAVEHAYGEAGGPIEVSVSPGQDELVVSVRDFGRGIGSATGGARGVRGYGMPMIEAIARRVDVQGGEGTRVEMTFGIGQAEPATVDGAAPGLQPTERILRRVLGVIGAQADMSVERLMEALLVVELAARHGLRHLIGEQVEIRVTPGNANFELRIGPLEPGGVRRVIDDSDVPAVGSVVERLAEDVGVEQGRAEDIECEYLLLRLGAQPGAA